MCCAFMVLFLLGPRIFNVFWWIFQPLRWQTAFSDIFGGSLWWIWPVLGIIFLPWTLLMYVIIFPVAGFWDWLFLILAIVADVASGGGGLWGNRDRVGM